MTQSLLPIGRLNKPFGLKGLIRCYIEAPYVARIKRPYFFFLQLEHARIPLKAKSFQVNPSGHGLIQFEHIEDRTAAEALSGKTMYVEAHSLKRPQPAHPYLSLVGFHVVDEVHGSLGSLQQVTVLPHHCIGTLLVHDREILFPMTPSVIKKISRRNKMLYMRLPDGLLDVYL